VEPAKQEAPGAPLLISVVLRCTSTHWVSRADGPMWCLHHQEGQVGALATIRKTWVNGTRDNLEARMTETSSSIASRFAQQVGRGRSLIIVAVTEVVLFVVANVTYGNGDDKHGAMRAVSNVVWAIFLVGFVVMIVFAIATLVRMIARRSRQNNANI
jgi:hypothetical protein